MEAVVIDACRTRVFCSRCSDTFTSQGELITVFQFPEIVAAYHFECYAREAKGWNPRGMPLNSTAMIWVALVFGIICMVLFVTSGLNPIFVVLASIVPAMRLLSWALVERKVSQVERPCQ